MPTPFSRQLSGKEQVEEPVYVALPDNTRVQVPTLEIEEDKYNIPYEQILPEAVITVPHIPTQGVTIGPNGDRYITWDNIAKYGYRFINTDSGEVLLVDPHDNYRVISRDINPKLIDEIRRRNLYDRTPGLVASIQRGWLKNPKAMVMHSKAVQEGGDDAAKIMLGIASIAFPGTTLGSARLIPKVGRAVARTAEVTDPAYWAGKAADAYNLGKVGITNETAQALATVPFAVHAAGEFVNNPNIETGFNTLASTPFLLGIFKHPIKIEQGSLYNLLGKGLKQGKQYDKNIENRRNRLIEILKKEKVDDDLISPLDQYAIPDEGTRQIFYDALRNHYYGKSGQRQPITPTQQPVESAPLTSAQQWTRTTNPNWSTQSTGVQPVETQLFKSEGHLSNEQYNSQYYTPRSTFREPSNTGSVRSEQISEPEASRITPEQSTTTQSTTQQSDQPMKPQSTTQPESQQTPEPQSTSTEEIPLIKGQPKHNRMEYKPTGKNPASWWVRLYTRPSRPKDKNYGRIYYTRSNHGTEAKPKYDYTKYKEWKQEWGSQQANRNTNLWGRLRGIYNTGINTTEIYDPRYFRTPSWGRRFRTFSVASGIGASPVLIYNGVTAGNNEENNRANEESRRSFVAPISNQRVNDWLNQATQEYNDSTNFTTINGDTVAIPRVYNPQTEQFMVPSYNDLGKHDRTGNYIRGYEVSNEQLTKYPKFYLFNGKRLNRNPGQLVTTPQTETKPDTTGWGDVYQLLDLSEDE